MAQLLEGLRRRFGRQAAPVEAEPKVYRGEPVDLSRYPGIEELIGAANFQAAGALIARTDPHLSPADLARIDMQLRHEAYRLVAAGAEPQTQWPPLPSTSDDPVDIAAEDLTVQALINGVRAHGYLIVRGFFAEQTCADLRAMIDRVFLAKQEPGMEDPDWFAYLCDVDGNLVSPWFRDVTHWEDSTLPVPDSPLLAKEVMDRFAQANVSELVRGYLGAVPALTLEKWNIRRVPPTTDTSWHQDGAFMGTHLHTLNLWITLSDCGTAASGLDILDKRLDKIVPTGAPGAHFDWDVSPVTVEEIRGESQVLSPDFAAGDAVFFDQFLLHRTGVKPTIHEVRYALESWFFTPWSKPDRYEGLLV